MTGVAVMAAAADAAAATGALKAVQTAVRIRVPSAVNARIAARKAAQRAGRMVAMIAVSVQTVARKAARIARWVMFASPRRVKPAVKPARTIATLPAARSVSTAHRTIVRTVSNALRRVNPASLVNLASRGQKQVAANVVAGNAASRVSPAAVSVMLPSRIRHWPTRRPWRPP